MDLTAEAAEAVGADGIGTVELARLVGATERQIEHWWQTDILTPSVRQARGTGDRNLYSFADAVAAGVLVQVAQGGAQRGQPCPLLDAFRRKALPLALSMMVEVYGDWDGVVAVFDRKPEVMPSMEGAVARMMEVRMERPGITTLLIPVGPLARKIAEGVLYEQATV